MGGNGYSGLNANSFSDFKSKLNHYLVGNEPIAFTVSVIQ